MQPIFRSAPKTLSRHRKAKGLTVGMPPFGTIRGKDGHLIPIETGGWLLPDGTFTVGNKKEPPPLEGAIFRGYYECALEILTLYSLGSLGLDKIAYRMNNNGWAYRDRTGLPRPIESDDVRRVVANWPEYGGISLYTKATARPAYEGYDVNELPFQEDRAVYDIELLRRVAAVRLERTQKPATDTGVKKQDYPYPLAGITYCARCEELAQAQGNESLRSRLGGKNSNITYEKLRYRHKPGSSCGVSNRSVPAEVLERDFVKLINLLSIKPEALQLMTELAIQIDKKRRGAAKEENLEQQKQEAIALCNRRIEAAVNLYQDGAIDRAEYVRLREQNELEIAHWQTRTTETERLALELAMCVQAVDKLASLWNTSTDDDRQGLARSLFVSLTYDLDRRRIVEFRLKPWAENFIVLRAGLYEDEKAKESQISGSQEQGKGMLHTGFEPVF
jgi:hypothetical protein